MLDVNWSTLEALSAKLLLMKPGCSGLSVHSRFLPCRVPVQWSKRACKNSSSVISLFPLFTAASRKHNDETSIGWDDSPVLSRDGRIFPERSARP
jgi:hypothetical protein